MTAQFSLYNSKGTKIKTISLKDSDTDVTAKTAKITGLDPGKYTLKETYACRGCVINETTYPITLSKTNPNWSPSKINRKNRNIRKLYFELQLLLCRNCFEKAGWVNK